ncbi:MAG: hypothetical protein QM204_00505 [Bacillota bacterium]|nr:hypothetical protein [Bacillota bacterium]NLL26188.1 hypothetical protein [Erysipelotrichia bacterium]
MKQYKYKYKDKDNTELKNKSYLRFFSIVYLVIVIIIATLFFTDLNRMRHNKPVVFSTWGFSYSPPIDIQENLIKISIEDYLMAKGDRQFKRHENEKAFASIRIYSYETKKEGVFYVYAWALERRYYLENDEIIKESETSFPYMFVVKEMDGVLVIVEAKVPRDGDYYKDDMKNLFPRIIRKKMEKVYDDGTIEKLALEIQQQIKMYFH